jgi:hypothetical protein
MTRRRGPGRILALALALALSLPASVAAGQSLPAAALPADAVPALAAPLSPAFTLLGVAPADIDRPSTPRALGISMLAGLNRGEGNVLPTDFALEVLPYWLASHPNLSFTTYSSPGLAQSLRQTFAVSVGTSTRTTSRRSSAAPATAAPLEVGIGVRAAIASGTATARVAQLAQRIAAAQTRLLVIDRLISSGTLPERPLPPEIAAALEALRGAETDLPAAAYRALLNDVSAAISRALATDSPEARAVAELQRLQADTTATLDKLALDLQRANRTRVGFTLDVAGGIVARDGNGVAEGGIVRRGAWITPGYSTERVSALAVFRYFHQDDGLRRGGAVDAGARIIWSASALTLSAEAIHRHDRAVERDRGSERITATFEVKASNRVAITATFGKDYADRSLEPRSGTISILGVSFGLEPSR